jgi:hypothetical protein
MSTAEGGNGQPAPGKGLAIGKFLLPLGLVGGTLAGAHLMREHSSFSTVPAWLLGGPLGALAGLMAAFVLLVAINALLRMVRPGPKAGDK